MDLWIRSQGNDLSKIEDFELSCDTFDYSTSIYGYSAKRRIFLGVYKNTERAFEVLNEIQEKIIHLQILQLKQKGPIYINFKNKDDYCVYEMPKE